jgi:AraC-like DNA-binding protein
VETMIKPSASDRIYRPTKLVAVVDTLSEEGLSPKEVLHGVGVGVDELHAPDTRISLDQLLVACKNAIRLSRDPSLPFRIGSTIHVSAYGMYGYAILCSTDFRKTFHFCVKYHVLASPLVTFSYSERKGLGIWTIDPILHPLVDRQLYRFIVEMQVGVHLSLQRDVMGPSFCPKEITVTYPRADDFRLVEAMTGSTLRFEQPANQFIFDCQWLGEPAKLGNRSTYADVVKLCDELLTDLSLRTGVAGRIRASLLQDIAKRPTIAATARHLGTTTRTLRRQLQQQGTSYRKLVDELRTQVAVKYLRDTIMTTEDIATAVGFCDPANFRHAFRRWTGKTPVEFRRDVQASPRRPTSKLK